SVFGDHDGILERRAERITRAPQFRDIAHEAERPRPRKLAAARVRLDVDSEVLAADERGIEFDFGFDAQAPCVRPQLAAAAVLTDLYGFEDFDVAPRRRERCHTGLIDGGDERFGAAVHDRNFRTVDL